MDAALEISAVTKTFGPTRAVDNLSLVVPRGATYGVIGPSGAGKTTAIRLILSILFPDEGTLTVLGRRSALDAKVAGSSKCCSRRFRRLSSCGASRLVLPR